VQFTRRIFYQDSGNSKSYSPKDCCNLQSLREPEPDRYYFGYTDQQHYYAVTPVHSVRNVGIYMDFDVSMRTHVTKTVSSSFSALRYIRSLLIARRVDGVDQTGLWQRDTRQSTGSATRQTSVCDNCSCTTVDWCVRTGSTTTSRQCFAICIGYRSRSASRFAWLC